MRDYRAWAHNCVFTNLDPCLDYAVVTNVDIFANVHLLCNLRSVTALERLVVGRRLKRLYRDPGAYLGISPNADPRRVVKVAIGTNDNILGNVQVVSIITGKRRGDKDIAAQMANDIIGIFPGWNPSSCEDSLEETLPRLL